MSKQGTISRSGAEAQRVPVKHAWSRSWGWTHSRDQNLEVEAGVRSQGLGSTNQDISRTKEVILSSLASFQTCWVRLRPGRRYGRRQVVGQDSGRRHEIKGRREAKCKLMVGEGFGKQHRIFLQSAQVIPQHRRLYNYHKMLSKQLRPFEESVQDVK